MSTPSTKSLLHPRSCHRDGYDFAALTACSPALKAFVRQSPAGTDSIDFGNPTAVKTLNQALLQHHYGIQHWDIPADYLCPPIPGRADYIHHVADLLAAGKEVPTGPEVRVLDIGTGANAIYPLIGVAEYGWSFVATDIDADALRSARAILAGNPQIADRIELRLQWSRQQCLQDVIKPQETFHVTLCNPPFFRNMKEATASTQRKVSNLTGKPAASPVRQCAGKEGELCCPGGELGFITRLIEESARRPTLSQWFTSLVSRSEHLPDLQRTLRHKGARQVRVLEMAQGQKKSRALAWSFL
ncbi:MAG: 23S rRNA (adenine(1618)-N(6))-methyltransferase RlmF [Verrucomicrobiaceae bacterium]|nr:23S rRNA (adenine(1618)-N(6))-methyltransferase RlmF [Verrucomicrobiaceae bacterium]